MKKPTEKGHSMKSLLYNVMKAEYIFKKNSDSQ